MTDRYISYRFIKQYGNTKLVVVDETGNIVNKNPIKEDLRGLKRFPEKDGRSRTRPVPIYTKEHLINELIRFENIEGRSPVYRDFNNNPEFPNCATYQRIFGSWNKALKLAGLELCHSYNSQVELKRFGKESYTDEELLGELIRFEKEHGRSPTQADFNNNPEFPSFVTYKRRFVSWIGALQLAGLDIDLMGPQGNSYRGRQAEIRVLNHFKELPTDLAGENPNSTYDGICPNGKTYDVKSSKFDLYKQRYHFGTANKDKDDEKEAIQWYYLLALNDDGIIKYAWRVPGEIVEKDDFHVGMNHDYKFNIENMKEFEITDKFKDIFN